VRVSARPLARRPAYVVDAYGLASATARTSCVITSRNYDYLLGGKDNFAADRAAADHVLEATPACAALGRKPAV